MRDAIGGTVTLTIIVVFIVLVLSYLAFNVNYTKTFRMKDKIVNCYNTCGKKDNSSKNCINECEPKIISYADSIGYDPKIDCGSWATSPSHHYCYKEVIVKKSDNAGVISEKGRTKKYYRIVTKIHFNIPIVNNILDLKWFSIEGQTNAYPVD